MLQVLVLCTSWYKLDAMKALRWIALVVPLWLLFLGVRRIYWSAANSQPRVIQCADAASTGLPERTLVTLEGCRADLPGIILQEWSHGRKERRVNIQMLVPTYHEGQAVSIVLVDSQSLLAGTLGAAREAGDAFLTYSVTGWVEGGDNFDSFERDSIAKRDGFADPTKFWSLEEGGQPGWTVGAIEIGVSFLFGFTLLLFFRRDSDALQITRG